MGKLNPKPYKQFKRDLGLWIWVYPDPVEFSDKGTKLENIIPEPYKNFKRKRK